MRIAVDAHMVGERETGNETYTVNLLRGLDEISSDDSYQVLTPHPERLNALSLPPAFEAVRTWPAQSLLRIPLATPIQAWLRKSDVLHMTTYISPPLSPCPTVVTIHDLSYLVYPSAFSMGVRLRLRTLVPGSIARAAHVIAVSEFTRQDVIRRYGLPPERITVTHLAAAPAFRRLPDGGGDRLPSGVREPFVLAVGNLEPRKNLARLVEAFSLLAGRANFTGQLVLAGKAAGSAGLNELVRSLGLESRVVLTGFVSQAELTLLYNRAALFAYPSLYEGFGLPPLEAMACGCPVVASNVTSLPEVLGDAALLVDPQSTAALAEAMAAVLERPELRLLLREKGYQRVSLYSWTKMATLTREVYQQVARRHAGPRAGVAG